ncbi:hypothetical protein WN944_029476 [Citrus x changshan-huyou]|uniref:Uncharacterized protein n=1 Tax=Citrus x changshan-huyou TaxID=2935761 RepID=A0AAP0QBR9_9ROSI
MLEIHSSGEETKLWYGTKWQKAQYEEVEPPVWRGRIFLPCPYGKSSFQSKELLSEPHSGYNIVISNGKSGQIRRPTPKGIDSKFRPMKSTSDPKNLLGIKE